MEKPNPESRIGKPKGTQPTGARRPVARTGAPVAAPVPESDATACDIADEDFAADLIQITDAKDRVRFRQRSAKNKYNPEGITLQAVWLGLQPYAFDELAAVPVKTRPSTWISKAPPWAETHLVQKRDEVLARFVKANPIAMLARSSLSDTVARWTYAAWYARSPQARLHGASMLKIIKPAKQGPPDRTPYTPESLAAAFDDLYDYGTGLRRCTMAAQTEKDITRYFSKPDCKALSSIGILTVETLERDGAGRPIYVYPSGHSVAVAFLTHVTGMKRQRLLGLTAGLRTAHAR